MIEVGDVVEVINDQEPICYGRKGVVTAIGMGDGLGIYWIEAFLIGIHPNKWVLTNNEVEVVQCATDD